MVTEFRSLEHVMENFFPGFNRVLDELSGKAVFLGNGTSLLPQYLAERVAVGSLQERPVLVDVFDYQVLLGDLQLIRDAFVNDRTQLPDDLPDGFWTKLNAQLENTQQIVDNIKARYYRATKYSVGSGRPPQAIKGAELVVNILGPGGDTLTEQLSLLARGGKLYTSHYYDRLPRGYTPQPSVISGNVVGQIITRV